MTQLTREQQEIVTIVMSAAAGEATDEQLSRISRLVIESDELRLFVVQLLSQEAWLTWHGSQARATEDRATSAEQLDRVLLVVGQGDATTPATAHSSRATSLVERAAANSTPHSARAWAVPATSAVLLLGVGAMLGAWAANWEGWGRKPAPLVANSALRGPIAGDQGVVLAGYEARLMHGTACVWGPEMRLRLSSDDNLRSGEAVNLIEGLAELEFSWPARGRATLRLEGPAGLVLMADSGVSLNYGKLSANVELQYDNFAVETPLGRILVTADAQIGVAASPQAVELHVFNGQAEIITPWASDTRSLDRLVVRADRSIRLAATEAGTVKIVRGIAAPSHFASQMSMATDLLEISGEYVAAIKEAAPVSYWRFDPPVDGLVRNEMGANYRGRVIGQPDWVDERGNMTIEFGTGLDADVLRACVVADRPLEGAAGHSYSIEVWAKPSHYHLGAMAGLVSPPGDVNVPPGLHGVLLELGGQRSFYSIIEHPGRVRYLHRDPPSFDPALGTSCFSKTPYGLRKWQYIVAVKDGPEMRLYVDGEVVASADDNTPLSDGLELLVGQLDRERDWRPFVGQLDELAFYNRALSDPEIQRHYHLVRPIPVLRGGI